MLSVTGGLDFNRLRLERTAEERSKIESWV